MPKKRPKILDISKPRAARTPLLASPRSASFAPDLLAWYDRCQRDLPWRSPKNSRATPDPWAVLVSEFMLQQTQVATVVPYFHRFISSFPTAARLASANQRQILLLWQGLGYYARARNLHAAARQIVRDHNGRVPSSIDHLLALPGIGRYTAGAIASIAFNIPAPIVDANVARVLCRLDKIRTDPRRPKTTQRLWQRAEQILPCQRVGDFNSALMELGATICTVKSPRCPQCPLLPHCRAAAAGIQQSIPAPRSAKPTPLLRRWTICLSRKNRWLIEQRPSTGRWASLWQFPTIEAAPTPPTAAFLSKQLNLPVSAPRPIGQVTHALTHRRYIFDVFVAHTNGRQIPTNSRPSQWIKIDQISSFPLSRPQSKIAQMIQTTSAPIQNLKPQF